MSSNGIKEGAVEGMGVKECVCPKCGSRDTEVLMRRCAGEVSMHGVCHECGYTSARVSGSAEDSDIVLDVVKKDFETVKVGDCPDGLPDKEDVVAALSDLMNTVCAASLCSDCPLRDLRSDEGPSRNASYGDAAYFASKNDLGERRIELKCAYTYRSSLRSYLDELYPSW